MRAGQRRRAEGGDRGGPLRGVREPVQTALLLRRIALARGVKGVAVRGLFLLPDVFVQAASLGAQQVDNVLANGYAALRELAAVIARAEDVDTARDFQYEFAPGEFRQSSELPFEAVTLIDFENVAGGSPGANLGSYKEMATRTVYLQTFTTLGAETLSRVINDMPAGLDAAARRTTNIFSGIGIAAVKYPAETIRDYLGHRFAQEALAGDWLRPDRVFRDELRRDEELKAAGNQSVRMPDIAVTCLESLDQFARRDRIAFFMEIVERLRPVLVDPGTRAERRVPLADQFLDAFLAQVSETFWSSRALQDIRARGVFEPTALRPRDKIPSVVRASENLLDADLAAIETALADQPDRIYNNMITVEDDRAAQELQPYNPQYYLVRSGPHPVQVRAFGEAAAAAPIAFAPTWTEIGTSCARLLLGALLVLWAAAAALLFARAPRFSKQSVASIRRRGQPIEAREPLRRGDARGNWRTVWGALIGRSLPARTEVEGLLLEATHGGPRLLLAGTSETIKLESDGRSVRTIRQESPRLQFIALPWNSAFTDRRQFEKPTLKRS